MYYFYTRASTDLQSDSNALQLSQIYSAIKSDATLQKLLTGHEFGRSFDDPASSRTTPMISRPQGSLLVQALTQGGPHVLIITEQHRFGGNPRDWLDFLEFCVDFDVVIYDVNSQQIATSPNQRHVTTTNASGYEEGIRVLRGLCRERSIARAKAGLTNTHFVPHGWIAVMRKPKVKRGKPYREMIPCPEERLHIKQLYDKWQASVDPRKRFLGHARTTPGLVAWFTDMSRHHKQQLRRYQKHQDSPEYWTSGAMEKAFRALREDFPIFNKDENEARHLTRERNRRRSNRGYVYPLPPHAVRRSSASRPLPASEPLAS